MAKNGLFHLSRSCSVPVTHCTRDLRKGCMPDVRSVAAATHVLLSVAGHSCIGQLGFHIA